MSTKNFQLSTSYFDSWSCFTFTFFKSHPINISIPELWMVVISKSPDDVNRGEGKMMMFMTVLVMTTMLAQEEEETNSQLANSIRKQEQVKEDDNIVLIFWKWVTRSCFWWHCNTRLFSALSLNNLGAEEEKGWYWAHGAEAAEGQRWQGNNFQRDILLQANISNLERIPFMTNLAKKCKCKCFHSKQIWSFLSKVTKESQIRNLKEEMNHQDELVEKLQV